VTDQTQLYSDAWNNHRTEFTVSFNGHFYSQIASMVAPCSSLLLCLAFHVWNRETCFLLQVSHRAYLKENIT
jgi:hypothetical protein